MKQLVKCAVFVSLLIALEAAMPRVLQAGEQPISFTPLVPIPGTVFDTTQKECKTTGRNFLPSGCTATLPSYLRGLYLTGVALAGLFAVFSIVRGGFTLLFTDSILNRLEGRKIILQALGGVVIVYSSYLLLNTINPSLADDLDLKLDFARPRKLEAVPDIFDQYQKALSDGEAAARTDIDNIRKQLLTGDAERHVLLDKADALTKDIDISKDLTSEQIAKLKEASVLTGLANAKAGADSATALMDKDLEAALTRINQNNLSNGCGEEVVYGEPDFNKCGAGYYLAKIRRDATAKVASLYKSGYKEEGDRVLTRLQETTQTILKKIGEQEFKNTKTLR